MSETKKTVLVVDDTPANIQLLSGLLRGQYKVKAATNGAKALQIAAGVPAPDVIILDVMMPEMDGYEVCRRLRGDASTASIPVVFVTGNTDEAERSKGMSLGAAGYVTKPVDPDELHACVEACVSDT